MTIGKNGLFIPAPLVLSKLRDHFRQTYMLNETQIETMLASSSKSLEHALSSVGEILKEPEDKERPVAFFHGLKGLLLNMGETEWASYIKAIENKLAAGGRIDYAMVIGIIEGGLGEILSYNGGDGAKSRFSQNVSPEKSR